MRIAIFELPQHVNILILQNSSSTNVFLQNIFQRDTEKDVETEPKPQA